MGEDAAAAARRIVEEVLAARPTPSGQDAGAPRTRVPDADTGRVGASALAAEDEDVETGAPAPAAGQEPRGQDEPGERSEVRSEAERIARQIVEEVLAAEAEVRVHGVPRDGLPAGDERTAKIVVDPEPTGETTQRVPGGSGAHASESVGPAGPGPGGSQGPGDPSSGQRVPDTAVPASSAEHDVGSDPDSAQAIVRRIVADVQAEAPSTPAEETDDASETVHLPATSSDPDSTASDSPGPEDSGASPGTVELPVGMTERSGDPETAIAGEEGTTRVVPRSGEKREVPSQSASGPLALADEVETGPGRPLVGWAPPPEPEPAPAPAAEESAPRTLRWLLASLLGAVALAVLFPLAVAALRALVSLG